MTLLLAALAFTFSPNYGSIAGGDTIQLTVPQAIVGTPAVSFDGVPATSVTVADAHTIQAVTPPHAEAAVVIRLQANGESADSFPYFAFIRARDTLLIPVANEVTGGFGTRWTTDIAVFNDSDEAISLTPDYCFSIGAFFPCKSDLVAQPHSTLVIPPRGYPEMYLNPPSDVRGKLHFNVRVRNAADPNDTGTQIPVTDHYRSERVVLPNIAVNRGSRSALRVYGTRNFELVVVRVFDETSGALLLQRAGGPFGVIPDSSLVFSDAFFDVLDVAADRVRIEIEHPHGQLWAMLTLTDNATQRVTVVTSQ